MSRSLKRVLSVLAALILVASTQLVVFAEMDEDEDGATGDAEWFADTDQDEAEPDDFPADSGDDGENSSSEPTEEEGETLGGGAAGEVATEDPDDPDESGESAEASARFAPAAADIANDYTELVAKLADSSVDEIEITDNFTLLDEHEIDRDIKFTSASGATLTSAGGKRHFKIPAGASVKLEFDGVVLDGDNNGGGIFAENAGDVEIIGARIENCWGPDSGAGIYSLDSGSIRMEGCVFNNNEAFARGAGVYIRYNSQGVSTVDIVDSTFKGNAARENDGGAVFVEGAASLTITGTTFDSNETHANGGAVYVGKTDLVKISADFSGNRNNSGWQGGAVYITGSKSADITGTFTGNTAQGGGGAVFVTGGDTLTVENAAFSGNKSYGAGNGGGAIRFENVAETSIQNCTFDDNYALHSGAAVYGLGPADDSAQPVRITVTDSDFSNNKTDKNGAAAFERNVEKVSISGGEFRNNSAAINGAAINLFSNVFNVEITGVHVEGNSSGGNGAIDYETNSDGRFRLTNSRVIGNSANGTACDDAGNLLSSRGGGLFLNIYGTGVTGDSRIENTTFDGNHAAQNGGGIMICNTQIVIADCDILGNTTAQNGGGISLEKGGDAVTIGGKSNITGNVAQIHGGGIFIPDERVQEAVIEADVVFHDNWASSFALELKPGDDVIHDDQVLTKHYSYMPESTDMFTYAYNNFDINYTKDITPSDAWRVSFVGNGGAIAEAGGKSHYVVYVDPNGASLLLDEPTVTKPGSTFLGWYLSDGETEWVFDTDEVYNHLILYAHWNTDTTKPGGGGGSSGGGSSTRDSYSTGSVTIIDEDTPLGLIELADEAIPLGPLPATGRTSAPLRTSGIPAVDLCADPDSPRRRRDDEEDSDENL